MSETASRNSRSASSGLIVEQQGLAQDAVFGRTRRILPQRQPQFVDRAVVVFLRHVGAGQAGVSLLPLRMLAVEFVHLADGCVELALIAISIAQIVADGGFAGSNPLGLAILRDGLRQIALLVQDQSQIGVCLPKCRPQRMACWYAAMARGWFPSACRAIPMS